MDMFMSISEIGKGKQIKPYVNRRKETIDKSMKSVNGKIIDKVSDTKISKGLIKWTLSIKLIWHKREKKMISTTRMYQNH